MSTEDYNGENDAPVIDLGALMKNIKKAKNNPNFQKEYLEKVRAEREGLIMPETRQEGNVGEDD